MLALSSVQSDNEITSFVYVVGSQINKTMVFISNNRCIEIRTVEDWLDAVTVQSLVSRYTPSEVCFALKPFVIKSLIEKGYDIIHYVDSDICFYSSPDFLNDFLSGGIDLLLTPHYLNPFPFDGRKPGVLTLLRGGCFNAGYIGLKNSQEGRRFLDWWSRCVFHFGKNEPALGTTGDQRWLDLSQTLFPTTNIVRHPGVNVAYWNLHERTLSKHGGKYFVGEHPLVFFHFSGFDPLKPHVLSQYQDRIAVEADSVLAEILLEYSETLLGLKFQEHKGYLYHRWWHSNHRTIQFARRLLRRNW